MNGFVGIPVVEDEDEKEYDDENGFTYGNPLCGEAASVTKAPSFS